jgi:hypothetical protein
VTFTPSGSVPYSSTITINYNIGQSTQAVTWGVTGTSTTLALLAISDWYGPKGPSGPNSSPYDYGTSGVPSDHTFWVSNNGAQTATLMADGGTLASGFGYKGSAYPGTGGTCGTSLASGATCSVVVTFTPSGSGTRSAVLTLSYSDGLATESATRSLTATATAAAFLTILDNQNSFGGPPSFDFGTWGVATTHTFTVTNSGAQSATSMMDGGTLSAPFSFAGGYPGTGGNCGTSLASGASCTIVVTFTPSGSTSASGAVSIGYQDGVASQMAARNLTGTSTTLALLVIADWVPGPGGGPSGSNPTPFDYGTRGVATDHTFYVFNTGAQSATSLVDGATLGNNFAYKGTTGYPGTGGTCGTSLAQGVRCSIVVTFTPSGTGPRSSTITLSYANGQATVTATRGVAGTATQRAYLIVSDQSGPGGCGDLCGPAGFGSIAQGTTTSRTFWVFNQGGAPTTSLTDAGVLASPFGYSAGFPGSGGNCGSVLAAGSSCTIVVTYAPTAAGTSSSDIVLNYGDGLGATQQAGRSVTGTAF